ncbi:MAG: MFS transporter [Croceibacterium sp.]
MSERPAAALAPTVGRQQAFWTLFVLFLVNAFNVGDRTLLGVVTEQVKQQLSLSDTQISLANGLLFVLFNLVGGLLIARFIDRGNRKRILALGVAGWSIATAATGLAHDFFTLSLARIGVGIGEATAFPAAMSMIPDLFSRATRGKAIAVFQSSTLIGIIGGTILAGVLAASLGWRVMFGICGGAGVALALVLVVTVREPSRERAGLAERATLPWGRDLLAGVQRILRQPGFPALAAGFGVSGMMVAVLGAWGPAFLQRAHGVPLVQVGVVIGPAVGIGGITGMLVSGVWADRLAARRGDSLAMLRVPLIALPLSIPFVAGFVAAPTLGLTMLSAAVMNFLVSCAYAPCVNYAVTNVDPGDRGLVSSVMLAASGLIGSALGPFIVGVLSDLLTPTYGANGLRYAIASMIPTPAIALAFLWLTVRQVRGRRAPPVT